MSDFEKDFRKIEEAFAQNSKINAIYHVRFLTPMILGLKEAKSYIERFWNLPDGLSRLREDLMRQLGISQETPTAAQPGARVIRSGKFCLTVTGEVTWDDWNEFFDHVSRELGL